MLFCYKHFCDNLCRSSCLSQTCCVLVQWCIFLILCSVLSMHFPCTFSVSLWFQYRYRDVANRANMYRCVLYSRGKSLKTPWDFTSSCFLSHFLLFSAWWCKLWIVCTAQTIHSFHHHAENSRKQELVKSRGVFKLFAAAVCDITNVIFFLCSYSVDDGAII